MQDSGKIRPLPVVVGAVLALAVGFGGGFAFQRATASSTAREASPVAASKPVPPSLDSKIRFKIPVSDTQPWRGPLTAPVTVVEWCDLRGDPCRASNSVMTELMQEYDGRLRWVFRHRPDVAHPVESRRMHEFARGVFRAQRGPDDFWKVRARLLELPGDLPASDAEMREIAKSVNADFDVIQQDNPQSKFARSLGIDVVFTGKFGVDDVPGLFVNGRRLQRVPTSQLKASLKSLIEDEFKEAQRLLDQGVQPAKLYDEMIKDGLWSKDDDPVKRRAENAAKAAEEAARQVTSMEAPSQPAGERH